MKVLFQVRAIIWKMKTGNKKLSSSRTQKNISTQCAEEINSGANLSAESYDTKHTDQVSRQYLFKRASIQSQTKI